MPNSYFEALTWVVTTRNLKPNQIINIKITIKSQKIPPTSIRLKYTTFSGYKETPQLSVELLHVKAIKHKRKKKKKKKKKKGFVGPK